MNALSTDRLLTLVKEYFLMTVGMFVYSFGWIGCIMPAKGMGGGAAGLSLVLSMPRCFWSPDSSWAGSSASRPSSRS